MGRVDLHAVEAGGLGADGRVGEGAGDAGDVGLSHLARHLPVVGPLHGGRADYADALAGRGRPHVHELLHRSAAARVQSVRYRGERSHERIVVGAEHPGAASHGVVAHPGVARNAASCPAGGHLAVALYVGLAGPSLRVGPVVAHRRADDAVPERHAPYARLLE